MNEARKEKEGALRREADILSLYDGNPAAFLEIIEKLTESQIGVLRGFLERNSPTDKIEEIGQRTRERMGLALEIIDYFATERMEGVDVGSTNKTIKSTFSMEEPDTGEADYETFKNTLTERTKRPIKALQVTQLEKGDVVHTVFSYMIDASAKMISFEIYLSVTRVSKTLITGTFYSHGIIHGGELISGEFSLPISSVIWQGEKPDGEGKSKGGGRSLDRILPDIHAQLPSENKMGFYETFISEMFLMTDGEREVKAPSFWGRMLDHMKK